MNRKINADKFLFKRFNHFVVIEDLGNDFNGRQRHVKVVCDCGTTKNMQFSNIKNNHTTHCGCLKKPSRLTHGLSNTKLYKACYGALDRCYNINCISYSNYSSRGIVIYEPWRNSISLMATDIFKEIGHAPNKTDSLDRIDNNKGYEPGNIRWASRHEQANNKSNNVGIKRHKNQNSFRYTLSYRKNKISYNENKWGKETAIELLEAWKVLLDILDR